MTGNDREMPGKGGLGEGKMDSGLERKTLKVS